MENRAVCAVTDLEATVLSYLDRPLPTAQVRKPWPKPCRIPLFTRSTGGYSA